ncbi:hypothetical protein chiPu_0008854 [Chiloscyllium punctatum]|uniref:Ig-like domain-containing protein n=1 Tax=Chiloscyllium punctatum TaxID=137246 RepID=A0A401SJ84_CHIPU|nr:hypothetical protein [Chiloscyllium punctatum]
MDHQSLLLSGLGEQTLRRLSIFLDNCTKKGWRKLAEVIGTDRRFKCSEKELEICSLKVLEPDGSPSRYFIQLLADRGCSVSHLISCLHRMDHTEAVQCIMSTGLLMPGLTTTPDTLQIIVQPKQQSAIVGDRVSLCCQAIGPPGLGYQWFRGKHEEGDTMVLPCYAVGEPPPKYQWFRNNRILPEANEPYLKINGVTTADRGDYCCHVFNLYHEAWSKVVTVEIGPNTSFNGAFFMGTDEGSSPGTQLNAFHWPVEFYATDKVALLMGNMNYLHHKQLKAPMVDVHELTNLLRQLDFKVVSLLDLTRLEMHRAVNEFLLLLDKGVYGLLYYAGHGYENYGNSFMVPIDAPGSFTSEHCLCVQNILQLMQEKQTGLNVFLLDMCRKRNMHDEIIPQMEALRVTANIVYGYATCPDAEAYEISQSELTNGIFINFLKRRLLEDEKITVLLDKVAEDMGKCELTKGRQALEIRSSLSERRSLRDLIKPPKHQDAYSARNLQWAKAHDLKHTNKECPEETGSILFTIKNFDYPDKCLYTRLSSLQKLRKELSFSICLQYQYKEMEDSIEEKKVVSIGKPLVSKLNLHGSEHQNEYISIYGSLQSSASEPSQLLIHDSYLTHSLLPSSLHSCNSLNDLEDYSSLYRYRKKSTRAQQNQSRLSAEATGLMTKETIEEITAQFKSLNSLH